MDRHSKGTRALPDSQDRGLQDGQDDAGWGPGSTEPGARGDPPNPAHEPSPASLLGTFGGGSAPRPPLATSPARPSPLRWQEHLRPGSARRGWDGVSGGQSCHPGPRCHSRTRRAPQPLTPRGSFHPLISPWLPPWSLPKTERVPGSDWERRCGGLWFVHTSAASRERDPFRGVRGRSASFSFLSPSLCPSGLGTARVSFWRLQIQEAPLSGRRREGPPRGCLGGVIQPRGGSAGCGVAARTWPGARGCCGVRCGAGVCAGPGRVCVP